MSGHRHRDSGDRHLAATDWAVALCHEHAAVEPGCQPAVLDRHVYLDPADYSTFQHMEYRAACQVVIGRVGSLLRRARPPIKHMTIRSLSGGNCRSSRRAGPISPSERGLACCTWLNASTLAVGYNAMAPRLFDGPVEVSPATPRQGVTKWPSVVTELWPSEPSTSRPSRPSSRRCVWRR